MQTNIFTPKVDQIFDDPQRKFARGQKLSFFEKWPQVTLLYEFDVEK